MKLLGPEAWKTRQSLVEKQKEIGQRVLNRVLKEHPEWRDKIKVDRPSDSKPAEKAPTSPAPTNSE